MQSWLSAHWVMIGVVSASLFLGRGFLREAVLRHKRSVGLSRGEVFCNHCGWKGSVSQAKRACGRCGSPNLTLQTR